MSGNKYIMTNEEQYQLTGYGMMRALRYKPQFEGKTVKRNYAHDKIRHNWIQFISQQTHALAAEWLVAKYLNLPFDFENTNFKDKADVGSCFEVKHTKWLDGSLILTEADRKEDIAILVTGEMPALRICGWIPIAMARRNKQQRSDGSWWINQDDLHPIDDLTRSKFYEANH